MKIEVRKSGRYYVLNGEITRPHRFFGIDGFKFINHVWAWIMGGALGEDGGAHLSRARRYIEREVLGNGCRRMRAPVELMFWGPPYFDLVAWEDAQGKVRQAPEPFRRPNVANTFDLVNLASATGSNYHATAGLRMAIRMFVVLAREFDIVIEIPICWTIKGRGPGDPRGTVSAWNEHFIGNEVEGFGRYLRQLREEGDGEGEHRVDPGGLNLICDAANEFTVHADVWSEKQLRNIARRWHERDAQGELLLISQSGDANRYDPPLSSREGVSGFDAICIHPPRDGAWEQSGDVARATWADELIDFNESQMGWTEEERAIWVPLIPKWANLGSTDLDRWAAMHRNFIENEIYTTFHTRRGMDAYWPETPPNRVEEVIRELTGATAPPPPGPGPGPSPPPPPDPPPPAPGLSVRRDDTGELVLERNPEVVKGGDEAFVLRELLALDLPPGRRLERLLVFHGLDLGDVAEMDTEIHANGKTIYARSEHKETRAPFNAWDTWDPTDYTEEIRRLEVAIVCRVNDRNQALDDHAIRVNRGGNRLTARPHWGIRLVWK